MQKQLISVDPGVHSHGVAFWQGGRLWSACFLQTESPFESSMRAVAGAQAVAGALVVQGYAGWPMVIEWPQQYAAATADRRDVSDLSGAAAALAALWLAPGCPVRFVVPREWKGQTPKHIHTARVVGGSVARQRLPRVRGFQPTAKPRLSPAELQTIQWTTRRQWNHNIVDAIGIGLYALNR